MKNVNFRLATTEDLAWAKANWSKVVADHMHIDDGFTVLACDNDLPIGLIAIVYKDLPQPLPPTHEAFVDIIEVRPEYRRNGLAKQLVKAAENMARQYGVYQIRGWSSEDKVAAIALWKVLGFALCPATVYPRGQEVHGYYFAKVL